MARLRSVLVLLQRGGMLELGLTSCTEDKSKTEVSYPENVLSGVDDGRGEGR